MSAYGTSRTIRPHSPLSTTQDSMNSGRSFLLGHDLFASVRDMIAPHQCCSMIQSGKPAKTVETTRRDNLPLFVFDHLDQLVLAPWAFKSAPVVVWCVIGLNSNEPHLRVANFATRTTHYPRMRDDLRSSHDAPHDYRSGSAVVCQQPPSRTADRKNNMPAKFVSRSGH